MKCVNCKNIILEPVAIEEGLVVAQCSRCNGLLMSLLNYDFWHHSHKEIAESVAVNCDVEDQKQVKQCPKCSRLMMKYRFSSNTENRLDYCAPCAEVWFDNGEWNLFSNLSLPKLKLVLSDAWQKKIRQDGIDNSQRNFYIKLLGEEDFETVFEFKQWLSKHEQKSQIKNFLSQS